MTKRTVARGSEPDAGEVRYRPMYARALRLRHLHPGGMLCFAYLEGSIALSLLLALAELLSWWVVLILPVSVALMVKVNDLVAGAVARSAARTPERERERVRREVSAFMPVVGRATVVTQPRSATDPGGDSTAAAGIGLRDGGADRPALETVSVPARSADEGAPHTDLARSDGQAAHGQDQLALEGAAHVETAGRYTAAGRHLDAAWRQHAFAMAHHTEHAEHASQRERQSASRRYE